MLVSDPQICKGRHILFERPEDRPRGRLCEFDTLCKRNDPFDNARNQNHSPSLPYSPYAESERITDDKVDLSPLVRRAQRTTLYRYISTNAIRENHDYSIYVINAMQVIACVHRLTHCTQARVLSGNRAVDECKTIKNLEIKKVSSTEHAFAVRVRCTAAVR